MQTEKIHKKPMIKASILLVFLVCTLLVVRFTLVKGFLTADQRGRFLDTAGFWAPLLIVVIYAVGVCLFVPGMVLGAMVAVIFGAYWGFIYVWIGTMAGASGAFFIGRYLGREFAASLVGDKLRRYDDAIERNGFTAVLYLRLAYFPFTPMNFGMA
jgi:uncharacterized membrane protein YdjX (TVP38/TMEM64 family)